MGKLVVPSPSPRGRLAGEGDGRTPGRAASVLCKLALEGDELRIFGVGGPWRLTWSVARWSGLEAGIDVEEAVETLAEEAGSGEEHDGHGELEDDEVGAEAAPEGAGGGAAPFAEAVAEVGVARHAAREAARRECRPRARPARRRARTCELRPMPFRYGMVASMCFGDEAEEEVHDDGGEGEAESAGGEGEHNAFGDELTDEPGAGCAEGAAHGHLAAALLGAHEEKAGDIDGGDEEKQRGSGEQNEEDGPDVADDDVGERAA